ncbi:DUF2158 domain-containing protein [Pseudomonas sp. MC042]|uniref:DUF2158 domain-containing protein n=2 Tax=Pseudomonas piscis TaxID=2614538 RepID=A0A7X1U611_9PSED|nr:DUF2158 domain-containing protein [Pseudomonas piscis]
MCPAYEDLEIMATGTEFAVGDIVKLKSGGPDMTVQYWDKSYACYTCQWFAGKKLESGDFKAESLEAKTSGAS